MDDVKRMFNKMINGQSTMKSELLTEIRKVDQKVDKLDKKIDGVEARLIKRIDKIGLSEARLEDDSPTVEEFDKLEKRVTKVEQTVVSL
jgi:hypothetical protein